MLTRRETSHRAGDPGTPSQSRQPRQPRKTTGRPVRLDVDGNGRAICNGWPSDWYASRDHGSPPPLTVITSCQW
jgi:hypothetical protein